MMTRSVFAADEEGILYGEFDCMRASDISLSLRISSSLLLGGLLIAAQGGCKGSKAVGYNVGYARTSLQGAPDKEAGKIRRFLVLHVKRPAAEALSASRPTPTFESISQKGATLTTLSTLGVGLTRCSSFASPKHSRWR